MNVEFVLYVVGLKFPELVNALAPVKLPVPLKVLGPLEVIPPDAVIKPLTVKNGAVTGPGKLEGLGSELLGKLMLPKLPAPVTVKEDAVIGAVKMVFPEKVVVPDKCTVPLADQLITTRSGSGVTPLR